MRVHHPVIAPRPTCKSYPIAILLHIHCAIYGHPPTPLFLPDTVQLAMAISCKGQLSDSFPSTARHPVCWPLQDIRSLQGFCGRTNLHCIAPPICKAHTVAIVMHDHCARYAPLPILPVYVIHHTILVMAILCEG